MDVVALEQAIQEDLAAGWLPFAVVATVGTTSTTSIDPVPHIATLCQRYGLWLHVDAAYAGFFAIDPDMRWILSGCEHADSLTMNPHKPLFMPFSCSVFWTRKPELLKTALSVSSAYLHPSHGSGDDLPDLSDYTDTLPHQFPALPLWMVLRFFGQEGIIAIHREHRRLARLVTQWIGESAAFELLAPPTALPVVCFRAHPQGVHDEAQLDALNRKLVRKVVAAGRYFLSDTELNGRYTIRIAIGNIRTTETEVAGLWEALRAGLATEVSFRHLPSEGGSR
jgi:aromatic-L-amino-acid decarboxylase